MYLLSIALFIFLLPCSIQASEDSQSDHSDVGADPVTKAMMEYFCNHSGKLVIKTSAKKHKIMANSLMSSDERGVLCHVRSTKLGFTKGSPYLLRISHQSLADEGAILREMLHEVEVVIRCIWDCVPHAFPIVLPRARDPLDVVTTGTIPSTFQALPLENFDGLTASWWIRLWHDLDDVSEVPDGSPRTQLLELPRIVNLYNQAKNSAMKLWTHGWIHGDLHVDNILYNPHTGGRDAMRIMNVQEAYHISDLEGEPLINWINHIVEDFRVFVYSFGKAVLIPQGHGVTRQSVEMIFPVMEHFDQEFSAVMSFTRFTGQQTQMTLLPPRILHIIDSLIPPAAQPPPPPDGLLERMARSFHMTERSVSKPQNEKLLLNSVWWFIIFTSFIVALLILQRKITSQPHTADIYLLLGEEL